MKSAVETLSPTRVKLTVEVPFEELKPSLDAAYKRIAGQVNMPGFRKGKVPPRVIDQRVGRGAVLEEAVNEALPQLLRRGRRGERGQGRSASPSVDVTDVRGRRATLTFTAEVDVRPEIDLPDLHAASRSPSTTPRSPTRTSTSSSKAARALRHAHDRRARRRRRRLRRPRHRRHARRRADRGRQPSAACPTRSAPAQLLEGMDEALVGLSAGRADDLHVHRWPAASGPDQPSRP